MHSHQKLPQGPDGIPTICYKMGGENIILWIFDTGDVAVSVRKAFISPIFKGGDRGKPASYWPAALRSSIYKIMERVVRAQLVDFLESVCLIDSTKHGSHPCRSTFSQFMLQYYSVLRILENRGNVDVLYLNFAKTFDKINLRCLVKKLRKLGVSGVLLRWIASFNLGRRQTVNVGSKMSCCLLTCQEFLRDWY